MKTTLNMCLPGALEVEWCLTSLKFLLLMHEEECLWYTLPVLLPPPLWLIFLPLQMDLFNSNAMLLLGQHLPLYVTLLIHPNTIFPLFSTSCANLYCDHAGIARSTNWRKCKPMLRRRRHNWVIVVRKNKLGKQKFDETFKSSSRSLPLKKPRSYLCCVLCFAHVLNNMSQPQQHLDPRAKATLRREKKWDLM